MYGISSLILISNHGINYVFCINYSLRSCLWTEQVWSKVLVCACPSVPLSWLIFSSLAHISLSPCLHFQFLTLIHMNYKCARPHFHDVLLYAFLSLRTHVFPFDLQVANLLCLHLTVSYKGAELSKFKLRTEVKKMFCDMKSLFCPRAYFDPCHLAIQVNQELSGYFPIDLCFR